MKYPRLSAIFVAVSAASLLMVSTASFAGHQKKMHENYKCESNYKAEVPPPCPPILMLHDGFYIGGGVGYDSYRINFSNTLTTSTGFVQNASWNTSATGWMGGLFAGYGLYFDWFYMGAEINVLTSGAEGNTNYSNNAGVQANTSLKARTSYGIALLPGFKINDSTLLYVRLGYLRTDFKAEFNVVNPIGSVNHSVSNWRNGFNYGVGLESYVAEDVSVRGEYTHTSFSSNSSTRTFTAPSGVTLTSTGKVEPSNNEFMLSLIYHFVF